MKVSGRAAEKPGVTQPSCVTAWVTRCMLPFNHLTFIERLLQPQLSCTPCHSVLQEAWWHRSALQWRKLGLRKWEQLCLGQFIKELQLYPPPPLSQACPPTWQGCCGLSRTMLGWLLCADLGVKHPFSQSFSRVSDPCSHTAVRDL